LKVKVNRRVLACVLIFIPSSISLVEPNLAAVAAAEPPGDLGIWCERRSEFAVTKAHEARLASSLRRITGYHALGFAPDGLLSLGDSTVCGGSAEARWILRTAFCSPAVFFIEDYSGFSSVTFGQAAREQVFAYGEGKISNVWRLRLDFDDFQQVAASANVKATFDEGFTFFHELLHGLGYTDASRIGELGTCEEILNGVRSELGLPLREQYFGEIWQITEKLTSVRMRFRSLQRNGNRLRSQTHYLFFLLDGPPNSLRSVGALMR